MSTASLAGKVADTPELDPSMATLVRKFAKDPKKGLDRAWRSCQDKLLYLSGPLTKILDLAIQSKETNTPLDPEVVLEWAQQAICLLGNANCAMSVEHRHSFLICLDPKCAALATSEAGSLSSGMLVGDRLGASEAKHQAVDSRLPDLAFNGAVEVLPTIRPSTPIVIEDVADPPEGIVEVVPLETSSKCGGSNFNKKVIVWPRTLYFENPPKGLTYIKLGTVLGGSQSCRGHDVGPAFAVRRFRPAHTGGGLFKGPPKKARPSFPVCGGGTWRAARDWSVGRLAVVAAGVDQRSCVEATTLPPIQGPGHALKAGDWVVIKKHLRKSCLEPRWKGPFQVILTTTTAVKCAGVPNWIHASHTKKVLCPTDEEVEALKLPVPDKTVPSAETEQKRTESEQATAEEKEILLENEESDSLGEDQGESSDSDDEAAGDKEPEAAEGSKKPEAAEGDKEPEAAESDTEPEESNGDEGLEESEKAGEPEQKGAFPETDDTEKEKENVTDSPEGGDNEEQNEKAQTSTEKIAGPSNGHGAKRRLSISPIKEKGKEGLNEGGRPKVKEKRKEVTVVEQSSSEEKDLAKEESASEAESKREAKLKRKRIPNRRYSGPEWAYAVNDDWTDEFVSLSIENEEEEEIPIEKKSFIDSVD
ncbi:uncharacterized protein [Pleurodeles waltl]|uniref:uncharacterized protein n=1 Tax=Pleurodeles waltl TaxID=8319 RepID=UPI00370989AF